ncbi:ATP-binding cassette domain-containing protein [Streptomyces sp. PRKS01-65]|nr:ATP-binding cassette domain-containing protein [Streptomyces harenosi]
MADLSSGTRLSRQIYQGQERQVWAAGVVCLLVSAACLAMPAAVGKLVEALAEGRDRALWVAVLAVLAVVMGGGNAVYAAVVAGVAERHILRLRNAMIHHTLRLPVRHVRKIGSGDLGSRLTADTMQLRGSLDIGLGQLPQAVLMVVGTVAAMLYLDPVLLGVTLAGFAAAALVITWLYRGLQRSALEHQQHLAQAAQGYAHALSALPTVKSLRAEGHVDSALNEMTERARRSGVDYAWRQALLSPVTALGQQLSLTGVIVVGALRITDGSLDLAALSAFLLYLLQVVTPVSVVAMGLGRLKAGLAIRGRFDEILRAPTEEDEAVPPTTAAAGPGRSDPRSVPAVAFRTVSFAYEDTPVISKLSFEAAVSGITALVGPSGAGKSTLLKLVERFELPGSGQVSVRGVPVEEWALPELRRQIAYVDQEATLLNDTVRNNLLLGCDRRVTDAELVQHLGRVGLADVIGDLPAGLDTVLGQGVELSGGQRQRLALARALLAETPIVLLDEPTSQLDSLSEDQFRRTLEDLAESRCIVVVAHRLSTVKRASKIVVVDAGTVVGEGTHDELLERSDLYRDLVNGQLLSGLESETTRAA